MRTMHLVIHRVAIVIGEVSPVDVIDVTIVIIIHTIIRDFQRVVPHLLFEVLMVVVNASVNDRHCDTLSNFPSPDLPCLGGIDVKARVVMHAPKLLHIGVIRKALFLVGLIQEVELLPQGSLLSICHNQTLRLCRKEVACVGRQRNSTILAAVHCKFHPVRRSCCLILRKQHAIVVHHNVSTTAAFEKDRTIMVGPDFKDA
mmetsp:Transcript_14572/g.37094  ORF Transcript_14572/g.37094 Transcript_14572/m.37094 type:complete len:201 (+) Transcript_14572:3009-3611(+)